MHGRLKVKSTAEQLEAKRKEREKKLQIYNGATSKIFQKKRNGELDEELLTLTAEVLAVNPDFYTLWNYRKETFQVLMKTEEKEALGKMFENELYFLESCLKMNPKSYGTWHHRCFVMDSMPDPDWKRELNLCSKFLQYDERNFHCWDYRRFVVQRAEISPEAEFEFSMSKISSNFSNYSSWHYRSKLLPVIHPDPAQPMGVKEEALLKEYELVQNGFFTDPDDQSNWFYHRWLMGRGEQSQSINYFHVSRTHKEVILCLQKPIQVYKSASIHIECNGSYLKNVTWNNQLKNCAFSTMWKAEGLELPSDLSCHLIVTVNEDTSGLCSAALHLKPEDAEQEVRPNVKGHTGSRFSQEMSAVKGDLLQEELESISQLMVLETDNKWVLLTVVLLMKALDPIKYNMEIMDNLEKLIALDFKRANYYRDLRSKFIIEVALDAQGGSKSTVSLRNCGLTKFYHTELFPYVTSLDLSRNKLRDVCHFSYLQQVRELQLSDNDIESCVGLEHLSKLENLLLNNNNIKSPEDLQALCTCAKLKTVNLTGNPLCENAVILDNIKELLPGVEIISS